jgi:NTE family protein
MSHVGLVLSGGGARAAYQVGAVRALSRILGTKECPFTILAGLSAGAINGAALASGADDFPRTVEHLTDVWMSLTPDAVYKTEVHSIAGLGARWVRDLALGGALGGRRVNHLLDTAPLRELLKREIDLSRVDKHFTEGRLRGLAVSATNYLTGTTVTFYDGAPDVKPWIRHGRIALREKLGVEHVMASAAIPIFFPPVPLDGKPFGDGGVRMTTPLSPAVHLGAEKIVAIGIRYFRSPEQTIQLNADLRAPHVTVAQIAGVLLNSLFLDSLDNDLERMQRINRTLGYIPEEVRRATPDFLRRIPTLSLRPSKDLGRLAADQYDSFPLTLRHMLRGIGATGNSGWDLLSYVAFQPGYVGKLIELGYDDTMARAAEVEAFFSAPPEQALDSPFAPLSAAQ